MLHPLRGGDEARVDHGGRTILLEHALSLLDEAFHALALLSARFLAEALEDLIEPLDLLLRDIDVLAEGLLQLGGVRSLRHPRESFQELLLRVVDVLQLLDVEISQGLETHGIRSSSDRAPTAKCCRRTCGSKACSPSGAVSGARRREARSRGPAHGTAISKADGRP